jgi:hypothetical protein
MPGLYYAEYLDLDTLLSAQKPLSDHPDELHFIIIHQIHELSVDRNQAGSGTEIESENPRRCLTISHNQSRQRASGSR